LVEVRAHAGNDISGASPGAFSNVLAEAASLSEYVVKVTAALDEEGLTVAEIQGAEPLRKRQRRADVAEVILARAGQASERVTFEVPSRTRNPQRLLVP
jgi:hypothetical protein